MTESNTPKTMNLSLLRQAVEKGAAIRNRRRLQPAGGPGDKLFPPTYEGGKYAMEERVVNGAKVPCVILDSVQSQANRMELALLEAARAGRISLPIVEVDFNQAEPPLPEVGVITSLEAPHRIADAILRDSTFSGKKFRDTEEGKSFADASAKCATELFRLCPTALIFGMWDSTGPKGGLGVKFQRAVVAEITGIEAATGAKTSSRIDPLGIQLGAGPIFLSNEDGWTLFEEEARMEKGKPVKLGKEGKPSEANHGNVKPTIEDNHGGVTVDYALQTIVLSPPALRRLNFPIVDADSAQLAQTNLAARTVLAALGLCAGILAVEQGCDLRSRCLLVPEEGQSEWDIIWGDGSLAPFALSAEGACKLLNEAVEAAVACGLSWRKEPLTLLPSKGLAELVHRSRKLAMQATVEGE